MALSAEAIFRHPALHPNIRRQSQALIQGYEANPRAGAVFATQQRWLLGHIGFALHFRGTQDRLVGLSTARFLEAVREHRVASRNTADAFLKELLKYNLIRRVPDTTDKRVRALEPVAATMESLWGWAVLHLATLDALQPEGRLEAFLGDPTLLQKMQPLIADGLLASPAIREPQKTFSLFTWLNNGGVVMDWLIAGIELTDMDADRIQTGVFSVSDMTVYLKLSRSHLMRKLREAEAMGSLGWEGKPGHSRMWVSRGFYDEYAMAQAVKLAIINEAFEACVGAKVAEPSRG